MLHIEGTSGNPNHLVFVAIPFPRILLIHCSRLSCFASSSCNQDYWTSDSGWAWGAQAQPTSTPLSLPLSPSLGLGLRFSLSFRPCMCVFASLYLLVCTGFSCYACGSQDQQVSRLVSTVTSLSTCSLSGPGTFATRVFTVRWQHTCLLIFHVHYKGGSCQHYTRVYSSWIFAGKS
jgi:hypothetical protein